jgi:hypothetical protein
MAFISGKQVRSNTVELAKLINQQSGYVIVGQGAGASVSAVEVTGDVTITNTGSTTISDSAVTNSKIADSTIGIGKLAAGVVVTSSTLSGAADTNIASTLAIKTYVDTEIAAITDVPDGSVTWNSLAAGLVVTSSTLSGNSSTTLVSSGAIKTYVDSQVSLAIQGLDVKDSVKLASTAAVDLTDITSAIDGVNIADGDRILFKNQADATENGIYDIQLTGSTFSAIRSVDADNTPGNEVTNGMFVAVTHGTANGGTAWILKVAGAVSLGTTDLDFVQFSGKQQLSAKSNGGISTASNEISIDPTNIDSSSATTSGDWASTSTFIASSNASNLKTLTLGTLVSVIRDNTDTSGLYQPVGSSALSISVKGLSTDLATPNATTGNFASTGITVVTDKKILGKVNVLVNGIAQRVSYGSQGSATYDCFFAASGQSNQSAARAVNAIDNGDVLYWNGTVAGFNLDTNDVIQLVYVDP